MDLSRELCNSTNPIPGKDFCLKSFELNYMVVCYKTNFSRTEGLWRAENGDINLSVTTLLAQFVVIITVNRLIMYAFRPFRLTRIAAEILGGILMGPSGIGFTPIGVKIFSQRSVLTLETIANLSLVFYMFLVGLEVDIKPVLQAPKKALSIAIAGFLIPFPVGYGLHYFFVGDNSSGGPAAAQFGPIFWGIALSTTNFPDLAQILEDLKLLHSEIGRTVLSAAVITDFFSWGLLVISVATVKDGQVFTLIFGSLFVIFCLVALRPALNAAVRDENNSHFEDYQIGIVLAAVIACGYITDAFGCHSILGGFMLGVVMPKGELKRVLMEKLDDFITGIMMPLYFIVVGLRTNRSHVFNGQFEVVKIVAVLVLAFGAKLISTFFAAVFINKMSPRDGMAMGFLMNTKGMLSLIVINSARNVKVLNNQTFTILICALWLMTAPVCPIISFTYRPSKRSGKFHQQRSLKSLQPGTDLRILACFHFTREITGIINLLDASNPTSQSPMTIFSVQLVENVGRSAAMLIVHDACKNEQEQNNDDEEDDDNEQSESSKYGAATAFDRLKNAKEGISVHQATIVSSYSTMHEDICDTAEEKQANLIILPFQLRPTMEGRTENTNGVHLRNVNKKVLEKSMCSVAVLVDRGHRLLTEPPSKLNRGEVVHRFIALFLGGPDDREALAYAERMSGNETVGLTVMRFVAAENLEGNHDEEEEENSLNNQCFEEFRQKTKDNPHVKLVEAVVGEGEEIMQVFTRTVEGEEYDLIIVGNGRRGPTLLLNKSKASSEWSEYPELGLLGDTLVVSTFAPNAWILVVQHGGSVEGIGFSNDQALVEDGGRLREHFGHMTWQPPVFQTPELAPFVSRTKCS